MTLTERKRLAKVYLEAAIRINDNTTETLFPRGVVLCEMREVTAHTKLWDAFDGYDGNMNPLEQVIALCFAACLAETGDL